MHVYRNKILDRQKFSTTHNRGIYIYPQKYLWYFSVIHFVDIQHKPRDIMCIRSHLAELAFEM